MAGGEPQSTFTAPLLQTHTHWQEYTDTGKNTTYGHWQEHTPVLCTSYELSPSQCIQIQTFLNFLSLCLHVSLSRVVKEIPLCVDVKAQNGGKHFNFKTQNDLEGSISKMISI